MAFHHPHQHQPNHHLTTTSICCCQATPCHQPPLSSSSSSSTIDPFLVSAIVAQLHQSQFVSSHHIKPTFRTPNQRHSNYETHQFHPHSQLLSSLLQRIDALEASINHFSSSSFGSFPRFNSLRDAAARIIQTHFRAFLVRRSRSLRELKQLASIKSSLASLKSSLNYHAFVDYDYVSHEAMDLVLKLDTFQSGDKMIRDGKKSVTREIVEFVELIDGICVKKQQVIRARKLKNMRLVRNDSSVHGTRGFRERNAGPKCQNGDSEEKKLMANLRDRVDRIGKMSKALEEQVVFGVTNAYGFEHVDDEHDDIIGQITSNYRSSDCRSVGNADKNLMANLRERVEKIGNMSKAIEKEEDFGEAKVKSFRHVDDDDGEDEDEDDVISQISGNHRSLKCKNVSSDEKKLMANLRERVEKIGRMSKEQDQDQEVFGEGGSKGFKHVDDEDDDIIDQIASNYGLNMKKNGPSIDAKKRVCFVEDDNLVRVYNIEGDSGNSSRQVDVIEDPKGTPDEEEARSDEEGSSQSSEDMRRCRSDKASEECENLNEDFTFSTPEPAKKMGTGAHFLSRKPTLKKVE